jgi:RHS repeat-associated protein
VVGGSFSRHGATASSRPRRVCLSCAQSGERPNDGLLGRQRLRSVRERARQTAVISPLVFDPDSPTGEFVYVRSETHYDAQGQQIQTIENLKQTTLDVGAMIDNSMARTTDYEYDDAGRLTAVILPAVTIDDPQNQGTPIDVRPRYEYAYDMYGNQKRIITNAYQLGATVYYLQKDIDGVDVVSATRALGQPLPLPENTTSTLFAYDELHRQASRTLPLGVIAGDGSFAETQHYNDTALSGLSNPESSVGLGQLEYSVDFEGRVTAFRYDNTPQAGGRMVGKYYYDAIADYDADKLDGTLDVPVQFVTYKYDALGRVVEIADSQFASAANPLTRQTYDAQGRLTQIDSPQGILNYEYDDQGRIKRTWTSHDTIGPGLDDAITDTRYGYDILGRLKIVIVSERNDAPVGEVTEYRYDKNGNLDQVETQGGVIADYDYDALNRLESLRHFLDGGNNTYDNGELVLAAYDYTVGADGKRTGAIETDDQGSTTTFDWVYDELGRLTKETFTDDLTPANDYSAEYFFDLASNRVRKAVDIDSDGLPDDVTDYLYDANDRLTRETFDGQASDTTTFYEYDGTTETKKTVYAGIHLTDPGGTFISQTTNTYNVRGRMESIVVDKTGSGGGTITSTYEYNDDGIRVGQTVDDNTTVEKTVYHVDPNNHTGYAQVLEEGADVDGDGRLDVGEIETTYTLGLDVIAQQSPGVANDDTLYFLYDGHGSTRALINAALELAEKYAYDAYGNMLPGAGLTTDPASALTSLLYSGEQTDPTGMQYLRARYYNPAVGRFNRLDPFAGNVQVPLSLHKYLYANAGPILHTDPSGREFSLVGSISLGSIASTISQINISVGDSVISSLGVVGSIDLAWQAATWVWDQLPQNVQDAVNRAIDFVLEHGGEALSVTAVAVGFVRFKRIRFFDKVTGYFDKLASLTPARRITSKLSETASGSYRRSAQRIWANVTGKFASEAGLQVHHRIPLEWAHLFPDAPPNRIANLVGMTPHDHTLVSGAWRTFKSALNGRQPTQAEIIRQAIDVESKFQHLMHFLG